MAFENAENEPDPEKRKALLSFVIVGTEPTGFELAGAIAEISQSVLNHDFKVINDSRTNSLCSFIGPGFISSQNAAAD
jgi:NADH dehydrogenase